MYGNTFSPNLQYAEWTSFMSEKEFCFRACTGPNARENCQHIYDGQSPPTRLSLLYLILLNISHGLLLEHARQLRCGQIRILQRRQRSSHGRLWYLHLVSKNSWKNIGRGVRRVVIPIISRHQGTSPTPGPHPVAPSSSCTPFPSITSSPLKRDLSAEKLVKRVHHARASPAPMH